MAAAGDDTDGERFDDLIFGRGGDRYGRSCRCIRDIDGSSEDCSQGSHHQHISVGGGCVTTGVVDLGIEDLLRSHNHLKGCVGIDTRGEVDDDDGALASLVRSGRNVFGVLNFARVIEWHGFVFLTLEWLLLDARWQLVALVKTFGPDDFDVDGVAARRGVAGEAG